MTHDRYFLSRVADSLLIFNEDGTVLYYPFGYAHYKSSLRRAGAADLAALRSSEEQRLIEGLRDVPKAQPISFRMSEKEMEKDWLFSRNMERLMAARDAYEKALSELAVSRTAGGCAGGSYGVDCCLHRAVRSSSGAG